MTYTEKIRIYPNKEQRQLIDERLIKTTILWDKLLAYTKYHWNTVGYVPGFINMSYKLSQSLKDETLPRSIREGVAKRLEAAYTRYFEEKKRGNQKVRPPKMKNNRIVQSYMHNKNISRKLFFDENHLWLDQQMGKIRCSRFRLPDGKPKNIIIKKLKSGKYYAFIRIEGSPTRQSPVPIQRKTAVGIDPGVMRFLTTSDNRFILPEFYSIKDQRRLSRAQRKLSRRQRGSLGYKKQLKKFDVLNEKIVNKRLDFQWKLALWFVMSYEIICIEQTMLTSLFQKNKHYKHKDHLKPKMQDMAHFQFRTILKHLSEKYGSLCIEVNSAYTSQMCSACSNLVQKTLMDRRHVCPFCGLDVDRDLNAAWNILDRGLSELNTGTVGTTGTVSFNNLKLFVFEKLQEFRKETTQVEIVTSGR